MLSRGDGCIFERTDGVPPEFGIVGDVDDVNNLVHISTADKSCCVKKSRVTKLESASNDIISQCLDSLNKNFITMQLETSKMLKDEADDLAFYQDPRISGRPRGENEDLCESMNKLSTSDGSQGVVEKRQEGSRRKWQVGDLCLCQWCEDGKWYFAKIIDINDGTGCCDVEFLYYGNEQHFISLDQIHRVEASSWKLVEDEDNTLAAQDLLSTAGMKSDEENLPTVLEPSTQSEKSDVKDTLVQDKRSSRRSELKSSNGPVLSHFWRSFLLETYGNDESAVRNLLYSWYICGYQTGYTMVCILQISLS
ncbi:unnamed protein product [Hydatigera taeniaeformis]|uniref:Tudor domain-containing protein n=1 Tax=Hydatigena taeniaeformis TaxID=6205 RepID=A0A0R3X002_HYDTA|nr:unnamed protein product [Hydatigera taeniaeformis]